MDEKVWVVQWRRYSRPEANADLFDIVEVYRQWADAFKKYSDLTDRGYKATFNEKTLY